LLPNAHLRTLEDGVDSLDAARERTGATIGYPGWGLIYQLLLNGLSWERPNVVIETGTNWGCSTIVLAQALRDSVGGGYVHSIEIDPECNARAQRNIDAAGLSDLVTLHVGDSLHVLPKVLAAIEEVRVAFLDGCHLHDHVVSEFELVLSKLAPQGLVLIDNTCPLADRNEDPRVFGALRTIKASHGGNIVNLEFTSWYTPGLAVWQR
jgi:predicted O-methyltransferase YrrM